MTFVQCRECQIIYDTEEPKREGKGTCDCGSTAVDPVPVKPACQTCNSNGVLYLIPSEPLDKGSLAGLDWVTCPDCHGKGYR